MFQISLQYVWEERRHWIVADAGSSPIPHQNQIQWTDCIMDKIVKKVEIEKFITTALKSILKLVKLQSLVTKRCKMWKMYACEDCKFCIFLYYARKIDTDIEKTVSIFRA